MKAVRIFLSTIAMLSPMLLLGQKLAAIEIVNHAAFQRKEVVTIPWKDIKANSDIEAGSFKIVEASTRQEIPYQLEYLGKQDIQNLLVYIDAAPKGKIILNVQKGKPGQFPVKTFGRYVPERKDDFAWENDKIGFRMYGKALEGTSENAHGIDVWVKRADRMVINERYKRGAYHQDHGDGLDYYHVGLTLGAGNSAPFVQDTIRYSGNYTEWEVLDNGPLRTTFQLRYRPWKAGDIPVNVIKTISIDAGSQLSRVEAHYAFSNAERLPVVVGIIKRKQPGSTLLNEQKGLLGYWEPESGRNGITGVGVILPGSPVKMGPDQDQLLVHTQVRTDQPLVYYTGAAWNKAKEITDDQEWFTYLRRFSQQLQQPLQVQIKK